MLLINNSSNPLAHGSYRLPKGERRDIPDEIAKQWLTIRGVERFISAAEVKKATKDAEKKIETLEAENAKLKEEIAKLKEAKAKDNEATKDAEKANPKSK